MHLPNELVQSVRGIASVLGTWSKTEVAGGLVVLVTIFSGAVKGVGWLLGHLRTRRQGSLEDRELRSLARQSFGEDALRQARLNFIEQSCSNLDPSKEIDLRATVSVQESVLKVLDRELGSGQSRHILVLADSGMGKTTLLVNLLARDLDLPVAKRRGVVLVSLSRDDALERIQQVKSKSDKILLLDAFDEDADAILDHKGRLAMLMKASRDFNATDRIVQWRCHLEISITLGLPGRHVVEVVQLVVDHDVATARVRPQAYPDALFQRHGLQGIRAVPANGRAQGRNRRVGHRMKLGHVNLAQSVVAGPKALLNSRGQRNAAILKDAFDCMPRYAAQIVGPKAVVPLKNLRRTKADIKHLPTCLQGVQFQVVVGSVAEEPVAISGVRMGGHAGTLTNRQRLANWRELAFNGHLNSVNHDCRFFY